MRYFILSVKAMVLASFFVFGQLASTKLIQAQDLTSPEEFFGHIMGADRKLARWDKIVEYYSANPGSYAIINSTDLILEYIKDIKTLLKGEQ